MCRVTESNPVCRSGLPPRARAHPLPQQCQPMAACPRPATRVRSYGLFLHQACPPAPRRPRSLTLFHRKMLILFNWLSPLHTILSQKAVPYTSLDSSILDGTSKVPLPNPSSPRSLTEHFLSHPFLQALLAAPPPVLLDLVSGLAEDVTTLSRLGLAGPRLGKRAARFADWCWFLSTLAGLVQNGLEVSIVDGLGRDSGSNHHGSSCPLTAYAFQEQTGCTSSRSQRARRLVHQHPRRTRKSSPVCIAGHTGCISYALNW